ncbi:MAG: T9SS type A sorting domain-containing protein, partial [Flavobacteriales bacterium]
KVIIGGEFDEYNGVPCNYIARINTDGTLDESFVASSETVFALALQPDGMIITGGFGFMERFTSSGVLDTGFDTGTSVDNTIFTLALQTDGKIMVAGDFENYNGTPRSKTLRVNGDGMTVGMQELNTDANTLMLYPNPTTGGNVWIEMPEGLEGAVHIELIQADGRIAHSARSQAHIIAGSNAHHAFDIDAALPQGTYFVRLTSAQRVHTGTVVIAH